MFEKILTTLLTVAALSIAGTFVHREFGGRATPRPPDPNVPLFQAGWEAAIPVGRTTGNPAPVRIVEFSDLECPFCAQAYARFHSDTSSIARRYRSKVAYTFVHFPLSMHRFARPAARGAECARGMGRFFPFVSAVFLKQDSLGLRPWSAYARDAGIADVAAFEKCASSSAPVTGIDSALAVARKLGVQTTPTIIINGWKYAGIMDDSTYVNAIEAALAGRRPNGAP